MQGNDLRALDLFDEYVEMPPHRQSRALARLNQTDPDLHDALVRLLVADGCEYALEALPLDSLAEVVNDALPPDHVEERIGKQLGAWRIERVLATGGMGTVYEASRADGQYQKRTALKCLRAELSSPSVLSAFLRERNHHAQLEHPHIASLIDGGVEPDGRPWFAMHLVDGDAIDEWCDRRQLDIAGRVDLLLQACDALEYAHEKGVLHQDIKPSNLLVTDKGHLFLLDFGLSALAGDNAAAAPRLAISNGYTPPEIMAGGAATAASDIYSLGVLLYHLLVADWPRPLTPLHTSFTRLSALPTRMLSTLAASARVGVALQRGCRSNRKLARLLKGDLDAIARKCVAERADERYRSVGELGEDLRRWRRQRPVSARDGGRWYAAVRLVQRNALAATLVAGISLSVLASVALFGWLRMLDRQEAQDARAVSALFEQTLGAATASGLSTARPSSRQLLQQTEAHLRGLRLDGSPAVKGQALLSLARSYAVLGDYPHALALTTEASRLFPADEQGAQGEMQATLATLLNLQAKHAEAREAAIKGLENHVASKSRADLTSLRLLTELARADWGLSEYEAAFATLSFAQQAARSLPAGVSRITQAELLTLRGQWSTLLLQLDSAEQDLQQAIELLGTSHPGLADDAREQLIRTLVNKARVQAAFDLAQALQRSREDRLGKDHPDTARSLRLLAELHMRQDSPGAALDSALAAAHTAIRSAYGDQHPEYGRVLLIESMAASKAAPGAGIAKGRDAVALLDRTLGARHETTLAAKAELARQLFEHAPSGSELRESISLLQEVAHSAQQRKLPAPRYKWLLAQALRQRMAEGVPSDARTAERLLQDALVEANRHLGATHPLTVQIRQALVGTARRPQQAAAPALL